MDSEVEQETMSNSNILKGSSLQVVMARFRIIRKEQENLNLSQTITGGICGTCSKSSENTPKLNGNCYLARLPFQNFAASCNFSHNTFWGLSHLLLWVFTISNNHKSMDSPSCNLIFKEVFFWPIAEILYRVLWFNFHKPT